MKKLILIRKVFLIILCINPLVHRAQTFPLLKQSYFNLSEIAFRVKIIGYDPDKTKPIIDEKFYTVQFLDSSQAHQWINFNITHLDTQLHHLSLYKPGTGKIMMANFSDTFETLYTLNKWDTIYACQQNPAGNSSFVFAFPLVKCFYPDDIHKNKYRFKDRGTSWYLEARSKYTGDNRHIWVNKTTGLVDSIHNYKFNKLLDRLTFEIYYTQNSSGKTFYRPLPAFYPLEIENPELKKFVNIPKPIRTMTKYDSTHIREFLSNNHQLLLMDFWFIGCRPCHQAFPILEKLRKEYPDSVLKIIAFSPFDTKSEIHHFKTKMHVNFDMAYDSLHLNLYYQVQAYPTTILINEKGEVVYRHQGSNGDLEMELRKILEALTKSQ